MVNFYQWWLMIGGLIAAGTVYGTSTMSSDWAWKTGMPSFHPRLSMFRSY